MFHHLCLRLMHQISLPLVHTLLYLQLIMIIPSPTWKLMILSLPDINQGMLINNLSIFYTNADQFLNKTDELEMLIAGSEPDIIMITEVLPKIHCNSISVAQFALSGYQAFFNLILTTLPLLSTYVVWSYIYPINYLLLKYSFQSISKNKSG